MNWTSRDPGDQDTGRAKRRGMPRARDLGQGDLLAPVTPAPANSGPSTRKGDPQTSRTAAARASENMTAKQLAVLTLFHLHGEMNDEELVDRYKLRRKELGDGVSADALIPQQSDSGIRSRRAELTAPTLGYLEYAGYKTRMKTNGEGRVHRVRKDAPKPPELEDLRRKMG